MIKVTKNNDYIKIEGHSNYDDYGKDIVCSSVSSIVTTSINAILMIDNESINYTDKEGLVEINILKHSEVIDLLIENMMNLLCELSEKYKNNIKTEVLP